jgi:hypothetical protein
MVFFHKSGGGPWKLTGGGMLLPMGLEAERAVFVRVDDIGWKAVAPMAMKNDAR